MAPIEAVIRSWGASWSSTPEVAVFSLFVVLLLSFICLALCTFCERNSFELRDGNVERTPSRLIRVVKLEDVLAAKENPMINEITKDEKDPGPMLERQAPPRPEVNPGQNNSTKEQGSPMQAPGPDRQALLRVRESKQKNPAPDSPHLETCINSLQSLSPPEKFNSPAPERDEALVGDENQDPWPALEASIQHIYDVIGEPRADSGADGVTAADVRVPGLDGNQSALSNEGSDSLAPLSMVEVEEEGACDKGWNPLYARISKKVKCPSPPPIPPPDDKEEEDESPPLPDRSLEEENE